MNLNKKGDLRGGKKPRSGPKKKKTAYEKIQAGEAGNLIVLRTPEVLKDADMPGVDDYMTAKQKNGRKMTDAERIYTEAWDWLHAHGCEGLILPQVLKEYAMACARKIQIEKALSKEGLLLDKGVAAPYASPYFKMLIDIEKQVISLYVMISEVVAKNSTSKGKALDDGLEALLSG